MKEKISCIICLSDIYRPKKSDFPCNCKPYLHNKCLDQWFKNFPNECPICRIDYEKIGIIEVTYNREYYISKKYRIILYIFISIGLFCSISTMVLYTIGYLLI